MILAEIIFADFPPLPFSIQRATTGYILDPSLEDFSIYNAKKDMRHKMPFSERIHKIVFETFPIRDR